MFFVANALATCTQHSGYSAVDLSYHQAFPLTSPKARCKHHIYSHSLTSLREDLSAAHKHGLFDIARNQLYAIILLFFIVFYYHTIHSHPACVSTRRRIHCRLSQLRHLLGSQSFQRLKPPTSPLQDSQKEYLRMLRESSPPRWLLYKWDSAGVIYGTRNIQSELEKVEDIQKKLAAVTEDIRQSYRRCIRRDGKETKTTDGCEWKTAEYNRIENDRNFPKGDEYPSFSTSTGQSAFDDSFVPERDASIMSQIERSTHAIRSDSSFGSFDGGIVPNGSLLSLENSENNGGRGDHGKERSNALRSEWMFEDQEDSR